MLRDDICFPEGGDTPLVFIGDSCHAFSPQLGQGANLALVDAYYLADTVGDRSLTDGLARYSKLRRSSVRFYQHATRWLTPLFQGDWWLGPLLRMAFCDIPCAIPITRKIGASVLMSTRRGVLSSLDPGDIHPDYALKENCR